MIMEYNKKDANIISEAWNESNQQMNCPKCGNDMSISQINPISGLDDDYISFDTIIECGFCSFKLRSESFKILGGVKDFDLKKISIGSWSNSGSRTSSNYEHVLDYNILKQLKESGELVEFLIVNNHVVEIIE
jgi:hypothetical protein